MSAAILLSRRRGVLAAAGPAAPTALGEPSAFASLDTVVDRPLIPAGYSAAIVADGPLAYYRLSETSGTTAVDAVGSNDATYAGAWQLGLDHTLTADTNKVARATGGYLSIPSLGHTGDYSVEFLCQIEWFASDVRLWRQGSDSYLSLNAGNIRIAQPSFSIIGPHNVEAQHLVTQFVITRSDTTLEAYTNGVKVTGSTTTSVDLLNATLWLLRDEVTDDQVRMFGRIGEVSLWDRALTPAEVADHYAGGA